MDSGGDGRVAKSAADYTSSSANVEFIHPKMRDDRVDEDTDDSFAWMTSYARVPVKNTPCLPQQRDLIFSLAMK